MSGFKIEYTTSEGGPWHVLNYLSSVRLPNGWIYDSNGFRRPPPTLVELTQLIISARDAAPEEIAKAVYARYKTRPDGPL